MIVRRLAEGRLLLVPQDAHAHLAGDLAAHLLPDEEDRGSAFVAAVRLHDNGWREADEEPLLDRERQMPASFLHMPDGPYVDVWRRGVERAVDIDPEVGLLVSLHGARFFRDRPRPGPAAFYEQQRRLQDQLLAQLGHGGTWRQLPPRLGEQVAWMRFLDGLSLFLCGEFPDEYTFDTPGAQYRATRSGDEVTLDPWPFTSGAERTFSLPAHELAGAPFEDEAALGKSFEKRAPVRLERSLRPAR